MPFVSTGEDVPPALSRRGLLGGAAALTSLVAVQATDVPAAEAAAGPVALSTDPVLHYLRRTTYGPTPALVSWVRAHGISAWLTQQLSPSTISDTACDLALKRFPSLTMSTAQIRGGYANGDWGPMKDVQQASLLRQMSSRRQLFELMVEFWHDHFNTGMSDKVWDTKTAFDRTIRSHAMGRFSDLLLATAKSPAMLNYLDNALSKGSDPNENYGRELLELHTVGVSGGYTETDVRQSTYALTGWTVDSNNSFVYDSSYRYVGALKVMGWTNANSSAANGLAVGASYLSYLAHHPATARRIATRLAQRFVSDSPSSTLVAALAKTYLASGTNMTSVLTTLLHHDEFKLSVGKKVARPVDDVVAAFRVVGARPSADTQTDAWDNLAWALGSAGQSPLTWGPPDGFPLTSGAWLSTSCMLGRWNLHQAAVDAWWTKGIVYQTNRSLLGGATPSSAGQMVDILCERLLFQKMASAHRSALLGFLGLTASSPVPSWMLDWRVGPLAALILNSPYWVAR